MNWEAIAAAADVLGAIGVIASVVYLARQVRTNGHQSRQAAIQSIVNQMNNIWTHMATDRKHADLWVRGSSDLTMLKDETERVQFSALMLSLFRPYEEIFHYWRDGRVDVWTWESISPQCRALMGTPGFGQWWEMRSAWFSAAFQRYVSETREGLPSYRRWAQETPAGAAAAQAQPKR